MPHPHLNRITEALWRVEPGSRVFALLDGARDSKIYAALRGTFLENACLYAGDLPVELLEAAPWLVQLENDDRFTRYLINNGWGQSWGVFLRSNASLEPVRRHLKKFLKARDESGRTFLFRFYDPRVLRVYLPTCLPAELKEFFGPVQSFVMENDNGDVAEFHLEAQTQQLVTKHSPLLFSAQSAASTPA